MGINFPASPLVGDKYPTPAQAGVPQYTWDGTMWTASSASTPFVKIAGDTMTGALTLPGNAASALHAVPKQQLDARVADVAAYSGMQINGDMVVNQQYPGASTAAVFSYPCDGWLQGWVGTMALTGNGGPLSGYIPGFGGLLYTQVTTAQPSLGANDWAAVYQNIEGWRMARLAWGTSGAAPVTIGFWTAHTQAGIYSVSLRNVDGTRSYVFTYTHATKDVAQYNVVTIPGCVDGAWNVTNGAGITLMFMLAAGSAIIAPSANAWLAGNYRAAPGQINAVATTPNIFRLTGVTVLPGIYAPTAAQSPLIMRPFDQELLTCQRYYEKSFNYGVVPANNIGASFTATATAFAANNGRAERVTYRTDKRADPTVAFFSSSDSPTPVAGQWNYYKGGWFPASGTAVVMVAGLTTGFQAQFLGTFPDTIALLVSGGWTSDARL